MSKKMSKGDQTWYVDKGRLLMYDVQLFSAVSVKVKFEVVRILSNMAPRQILRLRHDQQKRMEVSIL